MLIANQPQWREPIEKMGLLNEGEKMIEQIFIVTEGCYSEYQIDAVFSSIKKAESYIKKNELSNVDGGASIEIYEIDSVKGVIWSINREKKDGVEKISEY